MTRRRFIADESSGDRAALVGEHADHLVRVLRARVGQDFDIATGETVRRGRIAAVSDGRVEFDLGEEVPRSSLAEITLVLAVFKFDRLEWAIEKCTELNVTNIIPVIARRTEKHLAVAAEKRAERWRRIVREASEQSRRTAPPEIAVPVKLSEALQLPRFSRAPHHDEVAGAAARLRIVLDETEREASLGDILQAHGNLESLALAVGPEGGWTTDELRSFATSEWQWISASLGETILRAETAALAALAIARAAT